MDSDPPEPPTHVRDSCQQRSTLPAAGCACREWLVPGLPFRQVRAQSSGKFPAGDPALELRGFWRDMSCAVRLEPRTPHLTTRRAALATAVRKLMQRRFSRQVELCPWSASHERSWLACSSSSPSGLPCAPKVSCFFGTAAATVRVNQNQRRPRSLRLAAARSQFGDSLPRRCRLSTVCRVPAAGGETGCDIFREAKRRSRRPARCDC